MLKKVKNLITIIKVYLCVFVNRYKYLFFGRKGAEGKREMIVAGNYLFCFGVLRGAICHLTCQRIQIMWKRRVPDTFQGHWAADYM